jgi:hypothetical protein
MSVGQLAYFAMVLCGFALFLGIVGSVSVWSSLPARRRRARPTRAAL